MEIKRPSPIMFTVEDIGASAAPPHQTVTFDTILR